MKAVIEFFPCKCKLIDFPQRQFDKISAADWLAKKNSTIMKCRLIYGALEKKRGPKMGFKLVWKDSNMSFVQAIRPAGWPQNLPTNIVTNAP